MDCVLCSALGCERMESYEGTNGVNYDVYRCPACDLVFSDPMKPMDVDEYQAPPFNGYYSYRWEFGKTLDLIGDRKKLLEAGCGDGRFLKLALNKGLQVVGVDVNENAVKIAREHFGVDRAYGCTLEQFVADFPEDKFDAVCAFHIVEHLANPLLFLRSAVKVLKDKGVMVLAVPSQKRQSLLYSAREDWDRPPHHLTWWDENSLRKLMEMSGLRIVLKVDEPITAKSTMEALIKKIRFGFMKNIEKSRRRNKEQSGAGNDNGTGAFKFILERTKRIAVLPFVPFCLLADRSRGFTGRNILIMAEKA